MGVPPMLQIARYPHLARCCSKLLFLHICELGVAWEPCQLYGSDRAVSLLGDDDFSHVFFLGVVIVVVIAVQEHDDVRVLLDRPGLTQVRKHRPVIRTLLDRTGQAETVLPPAPAAHARSPLTTGKYPKFPAGGIPILRLPLHQLQVVDHDNAEIVLQLVFSAFAAKL